MVARALLVLALTAASLAAWRLLQTRAARRRDTASLESIGYRPGRPAILYFSAPGCAPCESVQKPALARLEDSYHGGLQVLEVDALERPALADAWGVLAVPTTFVIDAAGRPRRVNHGPTRESILRAQLGEVGAAAPGIESRRPSATARRTSDGGKRHGTIA